MFALIQADFFKLRKRAMGWVMLAIVALFVPLIMGATASIQPGKTNYNLPASLLAGIAPLALVGTFTAIGLGATLVGSEYGYDTWKNLLTRRHGRVPFILSKWLVMLGGICTALLTLLLLGAIVGLTLQSTMHLTGHPLQILPTQTLTLILTQMLLPITAGSIALLGAVIWRSSVAGIVLSFVWYIADAILAGFQPIASVGASISALQAQTTGLSLTSGGGVVPAQLPTQLPGPLAAVPSLLIIVYLIVPITVAVYLFSKRDMVGVN